MRVLQFGDSAIVYVVNDTRPRLEISLVDADDEYIDLSEKTLVAVYGLVVDDTLPDDPANAPMEVITTTPEINRARVNWQLSSFPSSGIYRLKVRVVDADGGRETTDNYLEFTVKEHLE